jgi:DoxX-like protein
MLLTLSVLLAIGCLVPGVAKISGQPRMRAAAAHFAISWQQYQLIGVAELAAAAGVLSGLLWRPIGLLAGLCMAVLLGGALVAHARARDSGAHVVPALAVFAIDMLYLAVAFSV